MFIVRPPYMQYTQSHEGTRFRIKPTLRLINFQTRNTHIEVFYALLFRIILLFSREYSCVICIDLKIISSEINSYITQCLDHVIYNVLLFLPVLLVSGQLRRFLFVCHETSLNTYCHGLSFIRNIFFYCRYL